MPPSLIKTFYKPAYFLPPGVRHLVFATFARHPRDSSKLKRCAGDRVIPGKRYRSDQRKVVAKRRVSWGGMARSRIETDRQKLATSRPCSIEYTAKLSRLSARGQTPLSSISRPGEDAIDWAKKQLPLYPAQKLFPLAVSLANHLSPPSSPPCL